MRKSRVETEYRHTCAKDGGITVHICRDIAERVRRYCQLTNQNKTMFVVRCVKERLDELEEKLAEEILREKTKDELIQMIIKGRN